jgi:type II secretory pathway component PulF
MRQKNVVFSALVTYCHYMVMLGEEVQNIKEVMAKFAHIYNLTEEHERDLGKSIAYALHQLAEMDSSE